MMVSIYLTHCKIKTSVESFFSFNAITLIFSLRPSEFYSFLTESIDTQCKSLIVYNFT